MERGGLGPCIQRPHPLVRIVYASAAKPIIRRCEGSNARRHRLADADHRRIRSALATALRTQNRIATHEDGDNRRRHATAEAQLANGLGLRHATAKGPT